MAIYRIYICNANTIGALEFLDLRGIYHFGLGEFWSVSEDQQCVYPCTLDRSVLLATQTCSTFLCMIILIAFTEISSEVE